MPTREIDQSRIHPLNKRRPRRGRYVLYWMQQAQRAAHNHALEHAVRCANADGVPLLIVFGLTENYPQANARHYHFMLQGLAETQHRLARRGLRLIVQAGHPADIALDFAAHATRIVCDRGYLRHQRQWRRRVGRQAKCPVTEVETDVVVPVQVASSKAEFAARTIRPKLHRQIEDYLIELRPTAIKRESIDSSRWGADEVDLSNIDRLIDTMNVDQSIRPSPYYHGGLRAARDRLRRFICDELPAYADRRHHPHLDCTSHLSPYLHFGQISPIEIALAVRDANAAPRHRDAYLEELIVRRELAHNFVWFTRNYDKFAGLPAWARRELLAHRNDPRPHRYTRRELEASRTHDPYWNAGMREMRITGYMHNHMRMYWGKKIVEWTNTPQYAYRTILALNNRYFLDGRDANSFANVGWIFGLHDRPWQSRPIFGSVRWMAATGLRRKTEPEAYVARVENLEDTQEVCPGSTTPFPPTH